MSIVPQTTSLKTSAPSVASLSTAPQPFAQVANDAHPLESRVANWKANEEQFKMNLLQRTQGAAEPIRRSMEMAIIEKSTFVPSVVGGPSNVHLDILKNNDATVDWEDVHTDQHVFNFHEELQRQMGVSSK